MVTTRAFKATVAVLALLALASGCRAVTGRSAGQYIDDKAITATVKTKLVGEKASNLTRVGVSTVNGTVYLTGTVDTPQEAARAAQVAGSVNGVRSVVNNVQITSAAASPVTTPQRLYTYPEGTYELRGAGTTSSPYYWVWTPRVAGTPPPSPPALPPAR